MKTQKASTPESKKTGKGWKVLKNLNPVRKPLVIKRKKDIEN